MTFSLFKFLLCTVGCLISVAFFTLLERKILGIMGLRYGPFKVSYGGFLQPMGDAGKLSNKESNYLSNFSFFFYYLSSSIMIVCSLTLYLFLCLDCSLVSFKVSIFIFLIVLGLNSLNSILCGWSSYSKFSLLGSLRSVSQLISYEVPLYIIIFTFFFLFSSFDLHLFSDTFFFFFFSPFLFLCWFVCVLAELNRTPYDFSEGESELVSGFNVEFGSLSFTLIFLAEYGSIFFFMIFSSFLFFSCSTLFSTFLFFLVIWIRSVVPRFRFDKLMSLSWKVLIPELGFFLILFSLFIF